MSRDIGSDNLTAASAKEVRPILLYQADFDAGVTRGWNGIGNLTALGQTWTGLGNLIAITSLEETYEIKATGFSVTLNGIASSMLSDALNANYQNKSMTIYLGFLNDAGALVDDPIVLMKGRMDVMNINNSGSVASIDVSCETRLIDFERPRRYTYTDSDQKQFYPNDRGFEHVSTIQDTEVLWGVE